MSQVLRLAMKTIGLRRVLQGGSAQIAALGHQRLQTLIAVAKHRSPYYADRLRHVDPSRVALNELPTLTKSEMMKNFDDLVTERDLKRSELDAFVSDPGRLGEWYKGKYALSRTSGTQGEKALIVQDRSMLELLFALQVARGSAFPATVASAITRFISPGRFAVITIGRGFFPTATGIAYCPEASKRFVNRLWIQQTEPIEQVVSQLNAFRPQVILSYASVLEMLAREVLTGRLRVTKKSGLRQVLNMSEPISQAAKKFVGEAFGIAVTDSYAMGECMALSTACPQGYGMHVQADWAMLEVVDQDNQPVPNGMPGQRVLVTNLYNTIQPFIRYVVEDVVTMSPTPCPCGSPLPVILQGRRPQRRNGLDPRRRSFPGSSPLCVCRCAGRMSRSRGLPNRANRAKSVQAEDFAGPRPAAKPRRLGQVDARGAGPVQFSGPHSVRFRIESTHWLRRARRKTETHHQPGWAAGEKRGRCTRSAEVGGIIPALTARLNNKDLCHAHGTPWACEAQCPPSTTIYRLGLRIRTHSRSTEIHQRTSPNEVDVSHMPTEYRGHGTNHRL